VRATFPSALLVTGIFFVLPVRAEPPRVTFAKGDGELRIAVGGKPFTRYVWRDEKITRPYFCDVRIPGGPQVTRNHPPVEGKDLTDHPTYHPGVWLAFGDISGNDYWRNAARVRHARFTREPEGGPGRGTFAVANEYLSADGKKVVCRETCTIEVRVRPQGVLLLWDSRFRADGAVFGDQEEMGLGVRVASALAVKRGGRIRNSDGKRNEAEVWGKHAAWCDYSGRLGERWVGVSLMPAPDNFRASWFHARDYGLLTANPFGRNAFTRGTPSRVPVKKGEPLRLRFGVLFHDSAREGEVDLAGAYKDYLGLVKGG
jgi:hypothetical protein